MYRYPNSPGDDDSYSPYPAGIVLGGTRSRADESDQYKATHLKDPKKPILHRRPPYPTRVEQGSKK